MNAATRTKLVFPSTRRIWLPLIAAVVFLVRNRTEKRQRSATSFRLSRSTSPQYNPGVLIRHKLKGFQHDLSTRYRAAHRTRRGISSGAGRYQRGQPRLPPRHGAGPARVQRPRDALAAKRRLSVRAGGWWRARRTGASPDSAKANHERIAARAFPA